MIYTFAYFKYLVKTDYTLEKKKKCSFVLF